MSIAMDTKVTCIIVSCFALANAGLIAVPSANFLEGPSTRTKVVGPDGSVIDAYAPGGKIVFDDNTGPILQPAPLVLVQPAVAEPHLYSAHKLQQAVLAEPLANTVEAIVTPQDIAANSINVQANFARVSEDGQKVFLQPGAPPRLETRESVPITEETEETATTELPTTTEETETASPDLSGTYVEDNFEKLFDDGSYRPEHH